MSVPKKQRLLTAFVNNVETSSEIEETETLPLSYSSNMGKETEGEISQ